MLSVSKPPFLVYLVYTLFVGFFTLVWVALVYGIWKGQGKMLEALGDRKGT